jgi:hypothetical protein
MRRPGWHPVVVNTAEGTTTNAGSITVIPGIASFAPPAGPVGTTVVISGGNFGSAGVVTFDSITALILSWSPTSISVVVPTGASAGNVIVTSNSQSSNTAVFTVIPTPAIAGLSPSSGPVGTSVTITGTNFGPTQGASTITFNGTPAAPASWSVGTIVVPVPTAATSGSIVITVNGVVSNGANFTVVPTIASLTPSSGTVGTLVAVAGTGFGPNQGSSTVTFNETAVAPIIWNATSITVPVPPAATTGNVVVTVGGVSSNGVSFTVQAGGFVATAGQMTAPRSEQTATQLTSGQVLITGGIDSSGVLNSAELYTPASQTFTAANPMNVARWLHTATLLNDGTVLIVGGSDLTNEETLDSAEIYSPTTGTFTLLTATLNTARVGHTATLLNNGQVLIVGGYDTNYGLISDAELYDPPSQTFIDLGDTNSPRYGHTATVLQNGQVLIAGGERDAIPTGAFNTAELFNLVNQTFTPVPVPMAAPREGHAATLLNDGQVLITGGDNPPSGSLNSAEIYDPPSNTFMAVASPLTVPRISHLMTLLNGGKVLIAGGATDSNTGSTAPNSAELYDPTTQSFVPVGNMTSVRERQTATLLNDGTVLEDGGTDGSNTFGTANIYTSSRLNGLASIAISPSAPSLGSGAQQLFTAVGTFGDGSTQTLASVQWTSSSSATATISSDATNPGVANGLASGTSTIMASAAGVRGSSTLTVTAPTLVSIAISPQDATIPEGATQQFTATGTYSDGSTQDLTATATWSASATVALTINSSGLAAGLFQGTATVQASVGSVNTSTSVTVAGPQLVSVVVTPATATVAQGSTQQYQAIGTCTDGSTRNVTTLLTWSSGTPTVATVTNTGLAKGVSQGTAMLTGAYQSISASATVTVTPPTLVSLTIVPNVASLSTGSTQQLTATGTYTDGSTQNLTASVTWASSNPTVISVSASGLATAAATGGATITATSGTLSGTAALVVTTGTTATNLNTSRYQHNATVLNNGQVLVAGGINCSSAGVCTYLNSAELYNPATDSFATTGAMATARSAPSVLLNNGKVLIAGGYACDSSGNCSSLGSAEIYDPVAGTFSSAGSMVSPRTGHTMTVLPNGTVLIAGGQNCSSTTSCTVLSSAEIYDPVAGTFTKAYTSMLFARYGASAVLLSSGWVLIAGGLGASNSLPAVAELYEGTSFTYGPSLNVPRFGASATLLNSGKVLVAGGSTCSLPGCPTNAAEIYDPVANTFTLVAGGMTIPRFSHSATLTTNGEVFVAGGYSSCASTCTEEESTEIYDPVAGTFSASQPFTTALAGHTGNLIQNGNVLLVGGIDAGVTLSADEWYQPASLTPPGLVSITVAPSSTLLVPGQTQQFVATGSFNDGSTQTLQSVIWNSSNPGVATISNSPGSAGIANTQAAGTATLTAIAGNAGGTATLTVSVPVSLSIAPITPVITVGSGQQFTATATFADNSVQDVTRYATWNTSNISTLLIGSVSTGMPGYASGANPGIATISASLGSIQATTSVTVQAAPAAPTPPVISAVTPASGTAGTQVTITGSGFGSAQGSGSVWLGSTFGTVVSWSNTQIVATVAAISSSGTAQVQQNGLSSNSVPFSVSTATISKVSPSSGVPGTRVTISGSGFGAAQGSGQVWLGTANAVVQSWSDTQVVAVVANGSTSGNALILQNGVFSNPLPFTVNSLQISSVSPNSGGAGTIVTITGTGFGATQGDGSVLLGSTAAQVIGWSNNQVVASVASNAVSGVAQIEQNGIWSNTITFTVPVGFGGGGGSSTSVALIPNSATMLVGQTRSIQALDSKGNPVTGLTWISNNTSVISLSTSDPPILIAVSPGTTTVTAGNSSTRVTVIGGTTFPTATVLWTNPGDGTGVTQIVPAVPSPTGKADVFSLQTDCNLQAVNSDGTVAWTTNIGAPPNGATACNNFLADFQGGVVVYNSQSIMKIEGATGYADSPYPVTNQNDTLSTPVVHTDGTIFTIYTSNPQNGPSTVSVVGINPISGNQLFSVPMDQSTYSSTYSETYGGSGSYSGSNPPQVFGAPMIAGDGYAYVPYAYTAASTSYQEVDEEEVVGPPYTGPWCSWVVGFDTTNYSSQTAMHLMLLRVGSDGSSSKIAVQDWNSTGQSYGITNNCDYVQAQSVNTPPVPSLTVSPLITQADQGVLLAWEADTSSYTSVSWAFNTADSDNMGSITLPATSTFNLATTTGSSVSSTTVNIPGQAGPIVPVLQAQDGTFFGTVGMGPQPGQVTQTNMISFSSSGNVAWSVPNDSPKIATADNGVTGVSGTTYDSNGKATGQNGNNNPAPTPSASAAIGTNALAHPADAGTSGQPGNLVSSAESWIVDKYETLNGDLSQLAKPPVIPATPPYWSFDGANRSMNQGSPLCHDDRDDFTPEYVVYKSGFVPYCMEFVSYVPVPNFPYSFETMNQDDIFTYNDHPKWALLRQIMLNGVVSIVNAYGSAPVVTSGYRSPYAQSIIDPSPTVPNMSAHPQEPHMKGLAVDMRTGGSKEVWQTLHDIGKSTTVNACVEPWKLQAQYNPANPYNHIHFDWGRACPQNTRYGDW